MTLCICPQGYTRSHILLLVALLFSPFLSSGTPAAPAVAVDEALCAFAVAEAVITLSAVLLL